MPRKCEISTRKQVYLPNANTLAYDKYKAKSGDYIVAKQEYRSIDKNDATVYFHNEVCRVLGVITSCDNDGEDYTGFLRVAMLSDDLHFAYERWIDPKEVIGCLDAEHIAPFMMAFLGASTNEMIIALRDNEGQLAVDKKTGKLWRYEDGDK